MPLEGVLRVFLHLIRDNVDIIVWGLLFQHLRPPPAHHFNNNFQF